MPVVVAVLAVVWYNHPNTKDIQSKRRDVHPLEKINAYFVKHHTLTLILMWIFVVIAVGIGATIAIAFTRMPYFQFLAWIAVPTILAIYFRLMYGRFENIRRQEREEQKQLANQTRYGHSKKKKRK